MMPNAQFQNRLAFLVLLPALAWNSMTPNAAADDWPTYRHDNHRSGVTQEKVDLTAMTETWRWQSKEPPQPAWYGPAKWDAYSGKDGLRSMRNYDPVFYTIAVGDSVYFGSTSEDAVYCLEAATGKERWIFHAGGPVRIAPTYVEGRLYFGADDGKAYCISAEEGSLIWQYQPVEEERFIPSNGRMISMSPIRTGVLVDQGKAYFGAALLPWRESWLCALDALSGSSTAEGCYQKRRRGVTMEGALLASPGKLYVLQGRAAPMVFDRLSGRHLGNLKGGGVFSVLTDDNELVSGGEDQKKDYLGINNPESKDRVATFENGNFMVVAQDLAFILRDEDILAVNRKEGNTLWTTPCDAPYGMILCGDTLLAGGNNKVEGYSIADGKRLGSLSVSGRAFGITAANGVLLISTDTGAIHCFK